MSNVATLPDKTKSVMVFMADRYGMEPAAFEATVRATCIKPDRNGRVASREEFAAFLLVAKQYDLNPLTKEIYAFMDKTGAVVPIVSVDGWANLINSHPKFDGMDFIDHADERGGLSAITCRMYRKDRSHEISITEYMAECRRDIDTWKRWPRRMLRHKAMIQAARYAFGFAGIYDDDEGERIIDSRQATMAEPPIPQIPQIQSQPPAIEHAPPDPAIPEPPVPKGANGAKQVADAARDQIEAMTERVAPKPEAPLIGKLRDACDAAVASKDVDALLAAWNDIVEPHIASNSLTGDLYAALSAVYQAAEDAFEK
jgi:phage recombination protein Bet